METMRGDRGGFVRHCSHEVNRRVTIPWCLRCYECRGVAPYPFRSERQRATNENSAFAHPTAGGGPVSGDVLQVSRSCSIPLSELTWFFTASGGPGGQHANTSNT